MELMLKRTPGVYLVGFMGSGKTTVGRLLAGRLGWAFVDLDDDIEADQKAAIPEIFDQLGEAAFRAVEAQMLRWRLRAVKTGRPTVIALGGGAFAQEENARILAGNGVSVWLDCPLEVARERIARETHRPLARDPERFGKLYAERREFYSRADYRVEAGGGSPEAIVDAILRLPVFQ